MRSQGVFHSDTEILVPFFDVDTMNVVWHGHYVKYLEVARCALLDKIGHNYTAMLESGYAWPVIDMQLRYVRGAVFGQTINVRASLVEWENRLKVNYLITDLVSGERLTRATTVQVAVEIAALGDDFRPLGRLIDERAIVNAVAALMATGGSTNHTIHWIAVARAAGIVLTWDDMDQLSQIVPLLTHVYPNGEADVNRFAAAGGPAFVFRELMDAGLMHDDLPTIAEGGMRAYAQEPRLFDGKVSYVPATATSADAEVVRPAANPFEAQGGLRLLRGNIGRSLIKLSAVKPQYRSIEAPAVVVDAPQVLNKLHAAGALPQDFVAVVRYQGPRSNGMPELHSLAPLLGLLQNQGRRRSRCSGGCRR